MLEAAAVVLSCSTRGVYTRGFPHAAHGDGRCRMCSLRSDLYEYRPSLALQQAAVADGNRWIYGTESRPVA